jgi:hypothetical protein
MVLVLVIFDNFHLFWSFEMGIPRFTLGIGSNWFCSESFVETVPIGSGNRFKCQKNAVLVGFGSGGSIP